MQTSRESKAPNSPSGCAIQHGFKLNEYGLFKVEDETKVAGDTEEGIYEALGMGWIDPELRELRGEIEAAIDRRLPRLLTLTDLLGDLHMHTTATDGRDDLESMAAAAHKMGHRTSPSPTQQGAGDGNGLDEVPRSSTPRESVQ